MFLSSKVFVIAVATVAHPSFSVAKETVHSKIQRKLEGEPLSCPDDCNWEDTMVPLLGTTITGTATGYGAFTIEDLGGDGSVVKNSANEGTHEFFTSDEDQMVVAYSPISGTACDFVPVQYTNNAAFIIVPTDDESLDGTEYAGSMNNCGFSVLHYCYCPPSSMPSVADSSSPTFTLSAIPSVADEAPTDSTDEDNDNISECCSDCDCAKGKTYLFDTIRSVFGGFD